MHAQTEVSGRLKEVRELLGYTQTGIAAAIGSKMRSWQQYEAGNRMPGGNVFQGLSRVGVNVNWVLTGEGSPLLSSVNAARGTNELSPPYAQPPSSTPPEPDPLDKALLADVLMVLREYQDRRSIRWKPDKEAALAAEIYKYMIEQDSPNDEDRQRTLHLVRTLMEGMNVEP